MRVGWSYKGGKLVYLTAQVTRNSDENSQWRVWIDGQPTDFRSWNKVAAMQWAEEQVGGGKA